MWYSGHLHLLSNNYLSLLQPDPSESWHKYGWWAQFGTFPLSMLHCVGVVVSLRCCWCCLRCYCLFVVWRFSLLPLSSLLLSSFTFLIEYGWWAQIDTFIVWGGLWVFVVVVVAFVVNVYSLCGGFNLFAVVFIFLVFVAIVYISNRIWLASICCHFSFFMILLFGG